MKGKLLFEEKQVFRGTVLWYIASSASILSAVGVIVYAIYSSDSEAYLAAAIASVVMLIVVLILGTSKLEVTIDSQNIYYKYPPFLSGEKTLRKEDIEEAYVRQYSPIAEYGGYGFRFSFRAGKALNIAGNMGLQLVLKNGKKLLIGTQKPELMGTAIAKLKENWNMNG